MSQLVVNPLTWVAYISEQYPTTNFGGEVSAIVQRDRSTGKGGYYLCAIQCVDISSIPAGSTILSTSKVEVYVEQVYGTAIGMNFARWASVPPPAEADVTWNNGNSFNTPNYGLSFPAGTGWWTITGADVAAFFQNALDVQAGQARAFWLTGGVAGANVGIKFASDDNTASPSLKPKWTIDYTPPAAGVAFGTITSDTLVPASWAGGSRRFGAVPSTEVVTVGSGARRWGAVPSDESVPADSDWTT